MNVFIFFQRVVHRNASFCVDELSGKFKMVEVKHIRLFRLVNWQKYVFRRHV